MENRKFCYEGGIVEYVNHISKSKETLHPKPIFFTKTVSDIIVEIGMQYNTSYAETVYTYVNNINTTEGGTHLSGYKAAMTRTVNAYAVEKGLLERRYRYASRR